MTKRNNVIKMKIRDLHHIPVKIYKGKHAKKCECPDCLKAKLKVFQQRVEDMTKMKPPASPEAMVPVQAHWRRQANYLRNSPEFRELVTEIVSQIFAQASKRNAK